jgi:hypothetical protein
MTHEGLDKTDFRDCNIIRLRVMIHSSPAPLEVAQRPCRGVKGLPCVYRVLVASCKTPCYGYSSSDRTLIDYKDNSIGRLRYRTIRPTPEQLRYPANFTARVLPQFFWRFVEFPDCHSRQDVTGELHLFQFYFKVLLPSNNCLLVSSVNRVCVRKNIAWWKCTVLVMFWPGEYIIFAIWLWCKMERQ